MDVLNQEQRHRNMASIKSKDSKIEILLRKMLWHRGVRYRKNKRILNTCPDIIITKYKIAIFCDGDFWHGRLFDKRIIKTNTVYWSEKIKRNIERDLENTIELRDNGWIVLRFWETEINHDLERVVNIIIDEIEKIKRKDTQ